MKTPSKRSGDRRWVWAFGAIVLAAGVLALAHDSAPGRPPVAPRSTTRFVRLSPAQTVLVPKAFDPCLVQAPNVDPRFARPAPRVDEPMIVASPVGGLYRGTLGPRP